MRATRSQTAMLVLVAAMGTVAGCYTGGGSHTGIDAQIRADPTPELQTLHQRQVDVDNALAIWSDENWRMFNQDLGRAFYTDRPSRLTREAIPH